MGHAGRHKESIALTQAAGAQLPLHASVIVDAVEGADELIVPAVILEELAAMREELLQVRIGGIQQTVVDLVGEGHVGVEVQSFEIPVRVFEDDVLEMIDRNAEWLRTGERA